MNDEMQEYETVKRYLAHAREQIEQGQPQEALETLVYAMSMIGLEVEALKATERVKDAMQNNQDVTSQLASLLGSLTLSTIPTTIQPQPHSIIQNNSNQSNNSIDGIHMQRLNITENNHRINTPHIQYTSIDEHEESFVCHRCNGVVKVSRREAHDTLWCSAANSDGMSHDDDDCIMDQAG